MRDFTTQALAAYGFDVRAQASADEAWELIEREEWDFDALVTDQVMPGMSGQALIQKARDKEPGRLYILLSGYTFDGHLRMDELPSGVRFLPKPYSAEDLVELIQSGLGR